MMLFLPRQQDVSHDELQACPGFSDCFFSKKDSQPLFDEAFRPFFRVVGPSGQGGINTGCPEDILVQLGEETTLSLPICFFSIHEQGQALWLHKYLGNASRFAFSAVRPQEMDEGMSDACTSPLCIHMENKEWSASAWFCLYAPNVFRASLGG